MRDEQTAFEDDPELERLFARIDSLSDEEVREIYRRLGINPDFEAARGRYLLGMLDEPRNVIRDDQDLDRAIREGRATRN